MAHKTIPPILKTTGDGSTTLYSSSFDQCYHNPNGAVAESRHVFFETPGVPEILREKTQTTIFEVGFGTGLHLLLLMDYLQNVSPESHTDYYSIEAFPIDEKTSLQFSFGDNSNLEKIKPILQKIFRDLKPGLNRFHISPKLTFHIYYGFFSDFFREEINVSNIDVVLHDAFSPDANPELWTPDVFKQLASVCNENAILTTYCAASSARAAMAVAGWKVTRAKGALGKREMTIASLNPEKISTFKRLNEQRLIQRYEQGDFDK